ncbi:MAG: proton-conducting transporter membrane subunit [Bacillota bacterium]
MSFYSSLPAWAALFPILGGLALYFITHYWNRRYREPLAIVIAVSQLVMVSLMYPAIRDGHVLQAGYRLFELPLSITFRVDGLGFFMALLASFLWLLAIIYSPRYLAHSHAHDRYYAFLLLAQGGCVGVMVAGDLLGLFVFFEFMAISTYVLIAHEEDAYSLFAGAKYLYMTVAGGLGIFFGLVVTYFLAGSLSFGQPGGLITQPSNLALYAFIGFLIGFGIKAGMFPLHVWLPDAHPAAPAPASALLSGIMIKTGAYGLIRVFHDIYSPRVFQEVHWETIVLILASVTILLGSALAITQDSLKRRLAYSSIAQIGYILLGIAMLNERAMVGAIYHIFTHAFMKGCLFLCAGAIIVKTGKKNISEMGGIGFKMPLTMICFTLASLSMVGIPPFNGFISKWQLSLAALESGREIFVALLIVSSLLNAVYYFPIIIAAFFNRKPETAEHGHAADSAAAHGNEPVPKLSLAGEAPLGMLLPTAILAAGCFLFALTPVNWPLEMIKIAAAALF